MFEGMSDDEEDFQSVSLAESEVLTSRLGPWSPFWMFVPRGVRPEPPAG